MKCLRLLLIQNHSILSKLTARRIYCESSIRAVKSDTHRQFGPFSSFWDEWYLEACEIRALLDEHVPNTALFLVELREFLVELEKKKRLSKSDVSYLAEVTSLTTDRLKDQKELLSELDERIYLHRQVTKQLMLVEAIDSLEE
jgi:hypothetical protein